MTGPTQDLFDWWRQTVGPAASPTTEADAAAEGTARPADGPIAASIGTQGDRRDSAANEPLTAMRREQLIDRILTLNGSATPTFLDRFDDEGLRHYLERLIQTAAPRGDRFGWVRRAETRAIVAHVREV